MKELSLTENKKSARNSGSYTLEASIVLMLFILITGLFYSYITSIIIQDRIQNALNKSALDISGYCYTASVVADCAQPVLETLSDKTGDEPDNLTGWLLSRGSGLLSFVRGGRESFDAEGVATDFLSGLKDCLTDGSDSSITEKALEDYDGSAAEALRVLLEGLVSDSAASLLGQTTGNVMCELTVPGYISDEPDKTLLACGVEDGLDGLDYSGSYVMPDGSDIVLCAEYTVMPFGNGLIPIKKTITQTASVATFVNKSEGGSVSVWSYSNTIRGRKILNRVKEENKLTAVKSGYTFDLYSEKSREYTLVFSVNLFAKTYSAYSGEEGEEAESTDLYTLSEYSVSKLLTKQAEKLINAVGKRGEGDTLEREYYGTATVHKSGMTLKVLAVIPEEAVCFLDELESIAADITAETGVEFEFERMDNVF